MQHAEVMLAVCDVDEQHSEPALTCLDSFGLPVTTQVLQTDLNSYSFMFTLFRQVSDNMTRHFPSCAMLTLCIFSAWVFLKCNWSETKDVLKKLMWRKESWWQFWCSFKCPPCHFEIKLCKLEIPGSKFRLAYGSVILSVSSTVKTYFITLSIFSSSSLSSFNLFLRWRCGMQHDSRGYLGNMLKIDSETSTYSCWIMMLQGSSAQREGSAEITESQFQLAW